MVLIIVYISVFAAILIALLVIIPAKKVDKNEKHTESGTLVSKDTKEDIENDQKS